MAALSPFSSHLLPVPGIALAELQDLPLDLIELQEAYTGPACQGHSGWPAEDGSRGTHACLDQLVSLRS